MTFKDVTDLGSWITGLPVTFKDIALLIFGITGSMWASFVCARFIEFRQIVRTAAALLMSQQSNPLPLREIGPPGKTRFHEMMAIRIALTDQGQFNASAAIERIFKEYDDEITFCEGEPERVPDDDFLGRSRVTAAHYARFEELYGQLIRTRADLLDLLYLSALARWLRSKRGIMNYNL